MSSNGTNDWSQVIRPLEKELDERNQIGGLGPDADGVGTIIYGLKAALKLASDASHRGDPTPPDPYAAKSENVADGTLVWIPKNGPVDVFENVERRCLTFDYWLTDSKTGTYTKLRYGPLADLMSDEIPV